MTLPVDLINGVRCQGCGSSEADCAWNGCECCAACTHTFDGGATRKFLCFGCNRIITTEKRPSGPPSSLCRLCAMRKSADLSRVA